MYERNAERKKYDRNDSTCVHSSLIKINVLNVDLVDIVFDEGWSYIVKRNQSRPNCA